MKWHKVAARNVLSAVTAAAVAVSPAIAGPALLFDSANGRILYAEDQDDQWFPASLTKIMTAYLVFEAIRDGKIGLQDKVKVSELAHSQPASRLGLPVGSEIAVDTALQALIVKSANDAAVAFARLDLRSDPIPQARVLVANLTAPLLREVASGIQGSPPERMVCSGLLVNEADGISAALAAAGLRADDRRVDGDWAALALSREAIR